MDPSVLWILQSSALRSIVIILKSTERVVRPSIFFSKSQDARAEGNRIGHVREGAKCRIAIVSIVIFLRNNKGRLFLYS